MCWWAAFSASAALFIVVNTAVFVFAPSNASRCISIVDKVPSICCNCFSYRFFRLSAWIAAENRKRLYNTNSSSYNNAELLIPIYSNCEMYSFSDSIIAPRHVTDTRTLLMSMQSYFIANTKTVDIEIFRPVVNNNNKHIGTKSSAKQPTLSTVTKWFVVSIHTPFIFRSVFSSSVQLLFDFLLEHFLLFHQQIFCFTQLLYRFASGHGFLLFTTTEQSSEKTHFDHFFRPIRTKLNTKRWMRNSIAFELLRNN